MAGQRTAWLDNARGFAIVLVVIMHADIMSERLGWNTFPILDPIWSGLSLVRMPLLLLLSGFLLPRSLMKSAGDFLYGKWAMIAWPYLVWITVRYIPEIGNTTPWDPENWLAAGYLWYLFYLFLYYVLALGLKRIHVSYTLVAAIAWAATLIPSPLTEFFYFATYFFAGASLWTLRPGVQIPRNAVTWPVVSVLAIVSWGVAGYFGNSVPYSVRVIIAAAPTMLILMVFQSLGQARWLAPLTFVGVNSIVYYVAHFPIVSAGARALHIVAPTLTEWYLVPLAIAAFAGCTLLALWRNVVPIRWLFVAPDFRRRRSDRKIGAAETASHREDMGERGSAPRAPSDPPGPHGPKAGV
ncbi:acyltransferase family protein [Microbacterium paulum]